MITTRKGQAVSITVWVLLVGSVLAMFARLITRFKVSRRYELDDALAIISLLLSVGSGIAISILDAHGLGASGGASSQSQIDIASKALYAGDMLFIATLCFAKLSIVALIHRLTPSRTHRRLNFVIAVLVATATITSEFVAAFQCAVPTTWVLRGDTCIERVAFWYYFGGIQIVSDVCLIGLPIHILLHLQLNMRRKIAVLLCFGARITDVAGIAIQFTFTKDWNSSDPLRDIWPWVLMTQVTQFVTIVSACIPYLQPLLKSYPSGMFMNDEIRRMHTKVSFQTTLEQADTVALRAPASSHSLTPTSMEISPV